VTSANAGRIVDQTVEVIVDAAKEILAEPPEQDMVRSMASRFSWKNNGDQLLNILRQTVGKS
jgi:hypothetical protein